MSKLRTIPDVVTDRQRAASDPAGSAWVSANAGSGKTHVLTQRVIRLLLGGVDPSRILCITFTKAAAANMSNRVFDALRRWALLDDTALNRAITDVGIRHPEAKHRRRARQLFALALETPGGLKVQTIHAFCTELLHRFPFEANVAARFEVLDEATETQLLEQLTMGVLTEASADPASALGRALAQAILAAADITLLDALREAVRQRGRLLRWIDSAGGLDAALRKLSADLGLSPGDTVESVTAAFFESLHLPASEWEAVAATLDLGIKTDQDRAAQLRAALGAGGAHNLDSYLSVFCTAELTPRKSIVTKTIRDQYPALAERLANEQTRVCDLLRRRHAVEARDRSAALFTLAHAVIVRFRAEKDRRGVLDYDDLIERALALLQDDGAAWVHYKLDRGIDHLLIDEAQDTSPKQWDLIDALTTEFFAGRGASERPRTIFAVGDEKQSIFSFQGAVPSAFADMRRHFETAHRRVGLPFTPIEFKHSFRSGPNVLGAVDTVFARAIAHIGLTADPVAPVHESLPDAAPGLVEIWETEKADDIKAIEAWDAPFDTQTETSPVVKLARRIAQSVADWRREGTRAGDVLVLVRRRGALFEAVIRALKAAGVPVAGADRLVLTDHIAVMDLLVLADALLMPADDLAVATVLKSPLLGFDDDDLFALAWKRHPLSLREALRRRSEAKFAAANHKLDAWSEAARALSPFQFYAQLLGAGGGRRQFLSRLGAEANDAIDEFLNLALDYERRETPSLQGFVAFMRAAQSEVKRDMEMERDEVRVMTVHGAKGLEAPVVILADTTTPAQIGRRPNLTILPAQDAAPGTPDRLAWAAASKTEPEILANARAVAKADAENEHRRLLYVAMTRAIDRLVVCGAEPKRKKRPENCWYDLVFDAIALLAVEDKSADGKTVWRFRKVESDSSPSEQEAHSPSDAPPPQPDWIARRVTPDAGPVRTLRPSDAGGAARAPRREPVPDEQKRAMARGNLIHRLLQSLPDLPSAVREPAAYDFLLRTSRDDLDEAALAAIVQPVMAILNDPAFAPLFAPGSRAEVPLAGRIGDRDIPAGIVDRLVVAPDSVLIADYKTNRTPPADAAATWAAHPSYIRQLAIYRALLAQLYPRRAIQAAIVWTETPRLMPISAALLDSAVGSLTSA